MKILAAPPAGIPGWHLDEPVWLEEPPPFGELQWRNVALTAGYRDSVTVLSAEELQVWHERDREQAFADVYGDEEWREILGARIAELERVLADPDAPRFLVLFSYEWESGFG